MKNFILVAAAIAALSFGASTAMADRNHRGHGHHGHGHHGRHGHRSHHVTPYHGYLHSPAYSHRYHSSYRYHGYRSPYYVPQYRHYGYPGYSRSGVGVYGRNFSFRLGF